MKYSALIGNPVAHSIAPQMFDIITKKLNVNYAHIKIKVDNSSQLKDVIHSLKTLGFIGFNITTPYKVDMYNILTDKNCDLETQKMQSVNSVMIKNNELMGFNTDGRGAIKAIQHFYDINERDNVLILGAGGVARSILYEISKITNHIVVFNEDKDVALQMCDLINPLAKAYDLADIKNLNQELGKATLIINATTVGMTPNLVSLIDEQVISKLPQKKCFFDVVFNPWETEMLSLARKYNHLTVSGGYMLIYQALYALEVWLDMKINFSKEDIVSLANELMMILEEGKSD